MAWLLYLCVSCLVSQWVQGINVCEKEIVTDAEGTITSPNYPENYPKSTKCTMRIQAPEGQTIKIVFGQVEIEDDSDDPSKCVDKLTLVDADGTTRMICGTGKPGDYTSKGNYVDVKFEADSTVEKSGFTLTYKIDTVVNICPSRNLPAGSGTINSPNFPNNYPDSIRCTVTLPIPKGYRYDVTFKSFDVQYDERCVYDRLDIKANTGRRLCGQGLPRPYSFRGETMTLDFITDDDTNDKGFELEYKLVEDTLPLEQCMCTEGGEYVHLELVQRFLKRGTDDISFSFKTTKKNGLLIYSKGTLRDYIFVAMKKGKLDVQLDLGTGVGRRKLGKDLADGKWHMFKLTRKDKTITVDLDEGTYKETFQTPWIFTMMDLPDGNFYFGGSNLHKVPFHLRTAHFYGCLKDVKVDTLEPLKSAVKREKFYSLVGRRRVKKCPYED